MLPWFKPVSRIKTIEDGKDISRQVAFLDLFEKRSGKWVIVRTLAARPGLS